MSDADFSMTIGGASPPNKESFEVINPANGSPFATAPDCSRAELDSAFEAAATAHHAWRKDIDDRRKVLQQVAETIAGAAQDLAPILTSEQGKPVRDAIGEIHGASYWFNAFAGLELPREVIQDDERMHSEIVRRPMGVVAAITPWNFPILLAAWKVAPALLAGNTVVLKPSPYTPLTTLKLSEILRGVLPDGVLNVVSGGDELGAWMTSHPTPRKVSFTGSVNTGKLVAASSAPDLKRVTLELGGNDPAILLEDVDPESVAQAIFNSSFANNGQVCSAIKRVYVHESRYESLVELLSERAQSARVGDGLGEVDFGPINNRPQYERVRGLVDDALAHGGQAAAGGKTLAGDGYFFEPTILTGVSDGTRIVDEEQFGPVLPVIPFRHLDDVIRRANATHFGLGGSVWGTDLDRVAETANALECGTVWMNAHMDVSPMRPFGGLKWSGIGVENGPLGYYAFTDIQVQNRYKPQQTP